ncbi:MAG: GNAT family N-acetyltransferase [Proteobacteria bacterium]|nr:GNAT family N-acetyltransferase [Pseudomonadota bacterium]
MKTRTANSNDLPALAILFDAYRQFYKQPQDIQGSESFLQQLMQKNQSHIIVAEQQNKLIGFTQLFLSFSSVRMQRTFILNDLYVDENHRKSGAGKALLNAATDFAKQENAAYVVLQTATNNNSAQNLYINNGWKKDEETYYFEHKV